jgi:hypothetical protein
LARLFSKKHLKRRQLSYSRYNYSVKLFVIASFLIFFTSVAPASYINFNSNLIGEQASGMGGAYTAMSGDSSSSGFYNPASLVKLTGTDISASATLFNKYDTTYGEGLELYRCGREGQSRFFPNHPSAIGNVYRFRKKWAFGFSIVVPDYDFFSGNIADGPTEQSFLSYTDEISLEWNCGLLQSQSQRMSLLGSASTTPLAA